MSDSTRSPKSAPALPQRRRLAERTAREFVQEVAEWSVLYTKEVSDPR